MNKPKVVIVGTNGIPAHYGGFETLAEYLSKYLNEDYDLYCYCSKTQKNRIDRYQNTKLLYLPFKANGWQSVIYDFISIVQSLWRFDVIILLGCTCSFAVWLKQFSKTKIVFNAVGAAEIQKVRGLKLFGPIEVFIKQLLVHIPVKYSDVVIIDSKANVGAFIKQHNREPLLIEYGGDQACKESIETNLLEKYPFLSTNYDVTVSRAFEDMNIHMVIDAYKHINNRIVVIVSNWSVSEYGRQLKAKYKDVYDNIILLDAIYNQKELNVIRSNASLYLHTHSKCGTAPSLVEAMSLGLPTICFDVPTNRETTENQALYFSTSDELAKQVSALDSSTTKVLKDKMLEIARRRYMWKHIINKYKSSIDQILLNNTQ